MTWANDRTSGDGKDSQSLARTRCPSVAIPEDVGDPSVPKASGIVELPFHVRWSEPAIMYDLGQRADRIRVYEQVLREGTEDDVRFYVEVGELVALLTNWCCLRLSGGHGRTGSCATEGLCLRAEPAATAGGHNSCRTQ